MEETGRCAKGRCVVCLGACAMDLIIRVPRLPEADEMVFAEGEPGLFPGGSTADFLLHGGFEKPTQTDDHKEKIIHP